MPVTGPLLNLQTYGIASYLLPRGQRTCSVHFSPRKCIQTCFVAQFCKYDCGPSSLTQGHYCPSNSRPSFLHQFFLPPGSFPSVYKPAVISNTLKKKKKKKPQSSLDSISTSSLLLLSLLLLYLRLALLDGRDFHALGQVISLGGGPRELGE